MIAVALLSALAVQNAPELVSPAFNMEMTDRGPKTAPPRVDLPKDGEEVVVFATNLGWIVFKMYPETAPKHVAQFKHLSESGFYNGVKFHRVIPNFVIQGGDPNSKNADRRDDGTGGYEVDGKEVTVVAEFNSIKHERGVLSAARSSDPNSFSSQFFVMHKDVFQLDGQYSAFGRVISGMDTVDKIVSLPRDEADNPFERNPAVILDAQVMKWPLADLDGKVVRGVQKRG